MDIGYISEIDPTWTDSSLTTILNPEAVIFANPIAQGACAADAIASAFNKPLDILFWCAGSQGSMYPFNGWVSNESSPLQSSLLVSERMAFKLHRQGMIMNTIGQNTAVCYEYPSPSASHCVRTGGTARCPGTCSPSDNASVLWEEWATDIRNCVFL